MNKQYKEYLLKQFGAAGEEMYSDWEAKYLEDLKMALKMMGVSERHLDCSFENYICTNDTQTKAVETLSTKKEWFLLLGKSGTGKNHLATALLRKYYYENKSCNAGIYKAKNLMDRICSLSFLEKANYLQRLEELDLLIINEIGRTNTKDFFRDTLFDLLDTRFDNYRQTVLIGNVSIDNLSTMFMRDENDTAMQRRLSHATLIDFNWEAYL